VCLVESPVEQGVQGIARMDDADDAVDVDVEQGQLRVGGVFDCPSTLVPNYAL